MIIPVNSFNSIPSSGEHTFSMYVVVGVGGIGVSVGSGVTVAVGASNEGIVVEVALTLAAGAAQALNSKARNRLPPAQSSKIDVNLSPSPVRLSTPTKKPATAQVATTGSAPIAAFFNALRMCSPKSF